MKIIGIYWIKNIVNNKLYIGSTTNLKNRWYRHEINLCKNKHENEYLQNAWNKYRKENFEFKLVEECKKEDLLFREQFWIDFYQSFNRRSGYNISPTAGNCYGIKHSEKTRKRVSETVKGRKHSEETKRKIGESNKNKIISIETRMKISKKNTGKKRTVEQKEKMKLFRRDQNGENNPISKLTWQQVREIREKYKIGCYSQAKLAEEYEVSRRGIRNIISYKSWKETDA